MLVAGGAAYAAGRAARADQSAYDDQGYDDQGYQEEVMPVPPPPAPTSGDTDADELKHLAELHDSGALTDDEFTAAKAKVLGT